MPSQDLDAPVTNSAIISCSTGETLLLDVDVTAASGDVTINLLADGVSVKAAIWRDRTLPAVTAAIGSGITIKDADTFEIKWTDIQMAAATPGLWIVEAKVKLADGRVCTVLSSTLVVEATALTF